MFCRQCGNKLDKGDLFCSSCGAPVDEPVQYTGESLAHNAAAGSRGQGFGEVVPSGAVPSGEYRSFEYARISVASDLSQVAIDCYESLGFELTGQKSSVPGGKTALSFRRSRKVRGRAQLAKIRRAMDDAMASITDMEAEKTRRATTQAISIGIASSLVLGLGMSCTMVWTHLMALGIAIGLLGIAGCVFAWMRYRKVCESDSAKIAPKIEGAYDRLATLCEEAQAVIRVA